jgi:carbonic anhydrase
VTLSTSIVIARASTGARGMGVMSAMVARRYARRMTINTDELVRRNAAFVAGGAFAGLPFPTPHTLRVLGCVDSRVDPAHVLGLDLGDALVMRNIGGRVTPAVLRSWGLLAQLGQRNPGDATKTDPPHLAILHHTDCGIKQLAAFPEQLAEFFEIPVTDLDTKAVKDPHAAVRIDVEIARHMLPSGFVISGLVYDVETGLIEVVVPSGPA